MRNLPHSVEVAFRPIGLEQQPMHASNANAITGQADEHFWILDERGISKNKSSKKPA
jgi:hypothetical protein